MNISLVIPVINELACIAAAVDSGWRAGVDEVLVVDGGSTDGTWQLLERLNCRSLRSPAGRAAQQNAGAASARGDVLLFQHADNRLSPRAADQIREALGNPRRLCGAFRQRIDSPRRVYRCLEWGNAWRVRWQGMPYGDQGIFVRREIFQQLGGFPEVPLMEDVLLMRRLRRLAWPVLLPGPLLVSPRRWERHGVVRQTMRNWSLLAALRLGVSPARLAAWYRRHDQPAEGA
ncbi:MAG: TIGR04283 family arsenosugar biosynthesis glycosyltransferase [Pirellulaceae bacterium]|nr:TIGR04283 family arsenosugar biosynthesis glycosyltransferase [Pirellulaceae bacterium]